MANSKLGTQRSDSEELQGHMAKLVRQANRYLDEIDSGDWEKPSIVGLTRVERAVALSEFIQFSVGLEVYVDESKGVVFL